MPEHPDLPASSDSLPLEIDVWEVQRMIATNSAAMLLDCRESFEREFCKIEPSLFIPMQEIPNRLIDLEPYRDTPLIVYCHAGVRSRHVAHWLRSQGFLTAQSMRDGIDAWSVLIDPSTPRY